MKEKLTRRNQMNIKSLPFTFAFLINQGYSTRICDSIINVVSNSTNEEMDMIKQYMDSGTFNQY